MASVQAALERRSHRPQARRAIRRVDGARVRGGLCGPGHGRLRWGLVLFGTDRRGRRRSVVRSIVRLADRSAAFGSGLGAIATAGPNPTVASAPKVAPARVVKNSLAIAALGINASIKGMSTCGGLISNAVYRWPCAGHNNMYLLGHAYGVFKPVHDGYHAGRLTPGMIASYTDASGKVHKYTLAWVEDLPIATWGKGATWAATSGSVITLQTCDGPSDSYRIILRFVPA